MTGSGLILPASCRRPVQMSKAIVFWQNKKLDHIMCAGHPTANPPSGYVRIECVHAHEVETWSARLRAQEERVRQMSDQEHFEWEDRIRAEQIKELKKNYREATDLNNRIFLSKAIEHFEQQRDKARPHHIKRETFMAVEAEEGIAP